MSREARRQDGTLADRARDRVGELGGVRGRQGDDRGRGIARQRAARRVHAHRRMRVDDDAARAIRAADLLRAGLFVDAIGVEIAPDRGQRTRRDGEFSRLR